jgi:hypothetical protein
MEKLILYFCLLWLIMAVVNYGYLYVATKFGFWKEFTEWLIKDDNIWTNETKYTPLWQFLLPPHCILPFIAIIVVSMYKFIFKPFYIIFIRPLIRFVDLLGDILYKPIKRNVFYEELENHCK